jgi:hypothetical protein
MEGPLQVSETLSDMDSSMHENPRRIHYGEGQFIDTFQVFGPTRYASEA